MIAKQQLVDFSLKKKLLLRKVDLGLVSREDCQDADYFLVEAAKYYGTATNRNCPLCASKELFEVSWVFGDSLKKQSGTARTEAEILRLVHNQFVFKVYVVEVCKMCKWNHLLYAYWASDREVAKQPATMDGNVSSI